jgi:FkbM family methyltransferase
MKFTPFATQDAIEINDARGAFLESFLPDLIRKSNITTALDVGCGALGVFSRLLKDLGLVVTALDGRPHNVAEARKLNPTVDFKVCDVENPSILSLGRFDLVLCFGLLYHLENPFLAIRNLFEITEKYLLIEAQTAPHKALISVMYEEPHAINQSLNYVAYMPSESSIIKMSYKVGFPKLYRSCHFPNHPDYRRSLRRKKVRTILMASKTDNPEPIKQWGSVKFCLIPEPNLPILSPRIWDTALGKVTRLVTEPSKSAECLFDWLFKFVPLSLTVKACKYMAKPHPLRVWPGWFLGARPSRNGASNFIRRLLWRIFSLRSLDETFILRWHNEIKVVAYPRVATCQSLFVTGYYEPNDLYLLKTLLKPGMVFIDIGANIGLYALFASKLVGNDGTVIAIEPSERDMERLRANVELNNGRSIKLRQTAISNSSGERELLIAEEEHSGQNTFGAFAYADVQNQGKVNVNTQTLDEVVRQEALTRVDVIKMDVEGHEFFALQEAKETLRIFHPILLVEISETALMNQGCTSSQILTFLDEMGYRIYIFSKQTGLPIPLDNRIENLDSENILAIHSSSEVSINGVA